jgi:PHD/YefM family antitoxin component YafN of YafNO toxin-antitoxin module
MISTRHTQSLTDFRQKATETLDRLNKTGEAEILTVNGEARAVLLAPAVYDEMSREAQAARDAIVIRQSMRDIDEGKGTEAGKFFDGLEAQLLAMKKPRRKKGYRK